MAKLVLVIDDEPDITTYYSTLLGDSGWQVAVANSGDDGLVLAEQQVPDIIVLDVMMPDRGGLSTLVALRKNEKTAKVPVVLVTGIQESLTHDFGDYLKRFHHYHPDAYIEKPIDPEILLAKLDELT
ncbi:MAG: response regulator [Deltaproteobacteria bacterium]|nr:response regulator [Deltaproteobacteria bacterium]